MSNFRIDCTTLMTYNIMPETRHQARMKCNLWIVNLIVQWYSDTVGRRSPHVLFIIIQKMEDLLNILAPCCIPWKIYPSKQEVIQLLYSLRVLSNFSYCQYGWILKFSVESMRRFNSLAKGFSNVHTYIIRII